MSSVILKFSIFFIWQLRRLFVDISIRCCQLFAGFGFSAFKIKVYNDRTAIAGKCRVVFPRPSFCSAFFQCFFFGDSLIALFHCSEFIIYAVNKSQVVFIAEISRIADIILFSLRFLL